MTNFLWHSLKVLLVWLSSLVLLAHRVCSVDFSKKSVPLSMSIEMRILYPAISSLPSRRVSCYILEEWDRIGVVCNCPFELLLRHYIIMLLLISKVVFLTKIFLTMATGWETHRLQVLRACVALIIWGVQVVCNSTTGLVDTVTVVLVVFIQVTDFDKLKVDYW